MATSTLGNGTLVLAGTTSGTTTVTATAVAGTTTLTLPAATDTLVGKATTDTLTNKTLTSPTIATPSVTGNLTMSTGNVVMSDGKGIDFSATSGSGTSELLADYEEGNWTPSVGGTATYGAQTGYYVKVGNIVYVKGTIITTLIGTGSTNTISGLPFTCRVTTPLSVAYFDTINTAATFLGIRISQANTTMLLVGTTAAQATITDSFSTFKNGTYLEFAGVYEVA